MLEGSSVVEVPRRAAVWGAKQGASCGCDDISPSESRRKPISDDPETRPAGTPVQVRIPPSATWCTGVFAKTACPRLTAEIYMVYGSEALPQLHDLSHVPSKQQYHERYPNHRLLYIHRSPAAWKRASPAVPATSGQIEQIGLGNRQLEQTENSLGRSRRSSRCPSRKHEKLREKDWACLHVVQNGGLSDAIEEPGVGGIGERQAWGVALWRGGVRRDWGVKSSLFAFTMEELWEINGDVVK